MVSPSLQRDLDLRGFGLRLTRTIEALGMSKNAFARSIGCDRGRVHHWTKGENWPDTAMLLEIHRVHGCSPDWFLLGRAHGLRGDLYEPLRALCEDHPRKPG